MVFSNQKFIFFHNIVLILLSVSKLLLLITTCAKKAPRAEARKPDPSAPVPPPTPAAGAAEKPSAPAPKVESGEPKVEPEGEKDKPSSKREVASVKADEGEKKEESDSKEKEKDSKEKEKGKEKEKSQKSKKQLPKVECEKSKIKKEETSKKTVKSIETRNALRKAWAMRIVKMKCKEICKMFQEKMKGFTPPDAHYTASDANNDFNRYADVKCIDETRVVLKGRKNDYIHASWVNIPDTDIKYILTQGPLNETCSEFWAMCYQEKVKYVLMLCGLVEGGVEKCAQYFPGKEGDKEKYGNMEVTFTKKEDEPVEGVGNSVMSVIDTDKPKSAPWELNHLYVPWWPDQLAPEDPKPMLELYRWVKKMNPDNAPIVVHCSAGVGRTSTFVGIDYANIRLQNEPDIEILDIVRELRCFRYQAIQSHVQFLFLHVCILEFFIQEGIIERDATVSAFMEEYKKHANKKLNKRNKEKEPEKSPKGEKT